MAKKTKTRRTVGLRKRTPRRRSGRNEVEDEELRIIPSDDTGESLCVEVSIPMAVERQLQESCGLRQGLMCLEILRKCSSGSTSESKKGGYDDVLGASESLRRSSSCSDSSEHLEGKGHYHGADLDDGRTRQTEAVSGSCSTDSTASSHDGSEFYNGGIGTVLRGKFRIVSELGRGTFGRVVECHYVDPDHFLEQIGLGHWRGSVRPKKSGVYAVKIARNRPHYTRDIEIEADMLRRVNGTGGRGMELFPLLVDHFRLPEGHACLVLEKLGMSLHDIIQKNNERPFEIMCVRDVAVQLFSALDHLHSLGIVHTDLKPENILLVDNNADEFDRRIKVIDFGSACFDKYKHKPRTVNTRQYRAPEILLRIGWSFPSDIWAAGCTVAELHLGHLLFPCKNDSEHLALMEKTIDPFPRWMIRKSAKLAGPNGPAKNFDVVQSRHHRGDVFLQTHHKMGDVLPPESAEFVKKSSDLLQLAGHEGIESGLCDLFKAVFSIDPSKRPTAAKALKLAAKIRDLPVPSM